MSSITCRRCGFVDPPRTHYGSRVCQARVFIANMKARGYAPIPYRGWTRRFRAEGVHVVHGPTTINATGNWAPAPFVESLKANRRRADFRKLPFHIQVELVVWWLTHQRQQPPAAP